MAKPTPQQAGSTPTVMIHYVQRVLYPSSIHLIEIADPEPCPELYPSFTRALPELYPSFTRALPELYPSFTRTLPELYPSFTRALPEFHSERRVDSANKRKARAIIDIREESARRIINKEHDAVTFTYCAGVKRSSAVYISLWFAVATSVVLVRRTTPYTTAPERSIIAHKQYILY
ncbi:hypothetical protein BSL78_13060 [Apostichopus japonicus]|uniref:Uncharacterized protein n=1 Tax=Stichopus japonicus TaxID=307972 RepID=A0A2G8KPW8_STIJA|nr:hypothetical protein BSL78_13060 [Apostichopus japonicus]